MKRFFFVRSDHSPKEKDGGKNWGRLGRENDGLHFLHLVCLEHKCASLWSLYSFLFSPSILSCPQIFFVFLSLLFHSFIISNPPSMPLPFSVLLSHWDDSHVLWKASEMKPHIGAVAGGRRRRRRRRLQKKLCWRSRPRHRPETKLDVVKLSNYLRKLQQNLRRQKTERERGGFFFSMYCKTSEAKWYL